MVHSKVIHKVICRPALLGGAIIGFFLSASTDRLRAEEGRVQANGIPRGGGALQVAQATGGRFAAGHRQRAVTDYRTTRHPRSRPDSAQKSQANDRVAVKPQPRRSYSHIRSSNNHRSLTHRMELGDRTFRAGDYAAAIDAYRRAMLSNPGNAIPKFALAHSLFAVGDYQKAAFLIHRGMRLLPHWPEVGSWLPGLYGDPNQLTEHLIALKTYLERNSEDRDAEFLLGYVTYFSGDLHGARGAFQRVAARSPQPDEDVMRFQQRIREILIALGEKVSEPTDDGARAMVATNSEPHRLENR